MITEYWSDLKSNSAFHFNEKMYHISNYSCLMTIFHASRNSAQNANFHREYFPKDPFIYNFSIVLFRYWKMLLIWQLLNMNSWRVFRVKMNSGIVGKYPLYLRIGSNESIITLCALGDFLFLPYARIWHLIFDKYFRITLHSLHIFSKK